MDAQTLQSGGVAKHLHWPRHLEWLLLLCENDLQMTKERHLSRDEDEVTEGNHQLNILPAPAVIHDHVKKRADVRIGRGGPTIEVKSQG